MFKIGDFVVKPNTGVCRIDDIVFLNLAGTGLKQYYILLPLDDKKAKLYVTTNVDRTRLRAIMTKNDAEEFIEKISEIDAADVPSDKMREQQYKEAFKTNEPESLVAIIKSLRNRRLLRLSQGKKVTSTDERYFRQAEKALYSELAFSLGVQAEEIQDIITETLEK